TETAQDWRQACRHISAVVFDPHPSGQNQSRRVSELILQKDADVGAIRRDTILSGKAAIKNGVLLFVIHARRKEIAEWQDEVALITHAAPPLMIIEERNEIIEGERGVGRRVGFGQILRCRINT